MEAKAKLSYLRISPKKVRLVADLIRGLTVEQAIIQLNNLNKASAKPLLKLLQSAIANAENNFKLQKDNLYIKEIKVDGAGMIKRWQPRAHGRATMIRKKMSHVFINLAEIKPTTKKAKKEKDVKKKEKLTRVSSAKDIKNVGAAEEVKKSKTEKVDKNIEQEKGQEIKDMRMEGKHRHQQHSDKRSNKGKKGFMKKIFSRKAG